MQREGSFLDEVAEGCQNIFEDIGTGTSGYLLVYIKLLLGKC